MSHFHPTGPIRVAFGMVGFRGNEPKPLAACVGVRYGASALEPPMLTFGTTDPSYSSI